MQYSPYMAAPVPACPDYCDDDTDPIRDDFERAARWIGYPLDTRRDECGEIVYGDPHTERAWIMWCLCAGGLEDSDCPKVTT